MRVIDFRQAFDAMLETTKSTEPADDWEIDLDEASKKPRNDSVRCEGCEN